MCETNKMLQPDSPRRAQLETKHNKYLNYFRKFSKVGFCLIVFSHHRGRSKDSDAGKVCGRREIELAVEWYPPKFDAFEYTTIW